MFQIRKSMFETNSSSTHSICISKKSYELPGYIIAHVGYYGWDIDCVEPIDYLFSALYGLDMNYVEPYENRVNRDVLSPNTLIFKFISVLKKYGVTVELVKDIHCSCYGVDHDSELFPFIQSLLENDDLLLRFLFSPESCVYTGNDNECDEDSMCFCAKKYIYTYDGEQSNLNHNDKLYEYYFKDN